MDLKGFFLSASNFKKKKQYFRKITTQNTVQTIWGPLILWCFSSQSASFWHILHNRRDSGQKGLHKSVLCVHSWVYWTDYPSLGLPYSRRISIVKHACCHLLLIHLKRDQSTERPSRKTLASMCVRAPRRFVFSQKEKIWRWMYWTKIGPDVDIILCRGLNRTLHILKRTKRWCYVACSL